MRTPTTPPRRPAPFALSAALVAVLLPTAAAAQQDTRDALIARVEAPRSDDPETRAGLSLEALMAQLGVPGVSVAVIHDFEVHWAKGYGVADVQTGRPVDPATLFQAASISKPLTAMAALSLAREGRLSLDRDVNELLKSWKVPSGEHGWSEPVTPRALFSHTSGADDGFGFPGYDPSLPRPTVVQILNGEAPSTLGPVLFARPPFQAYKYSGGGTTIMQLALTDLTGVPFEELLRTRVLAPLGMSRSTYQQPLPPELAARAAHAHDGAGAHMAAPWHVYPEQAAAGLWTTPSDLARFVLEVQQAVRGPEGAVLDQNGAREMITPVGVGSYGVGLSLEKRGEGWYFSHGGSNRGFRAHIVGHVRKGYGLVVMTNANNGTALIQEIEQRVIAAYGWDVLDRPLPRQ